MCMWICTEQKGDEHKALNENGMEVNNMLNYNAHTFIFMWKLGVDRIIMLH